MSEDRRHRDHIWSSTYDTLLRKTGDVDAAANAADRAVARFLADRPAAREPVEDDTKALPAPGAGEG